jgi:APA family basic amino acid/polyamine antiporter
VRLSRGLGVPALFAVGSSAVGASTYFVLGVVAGDALGLTPFVFAAAAVFFVLTVMTYAENAARHPDRGGASSASRYAFDELWSFVAGWAIVLDYLIVMALAAFAVSDYLAAFWPELGRGWLERAVSAATLALVAVANVRGVRADRLGSLLRVGLVNLVVALVVIGVGLVQLYEPGRILESVELGEAPRWRDLVFAAVVSTVALTGVEAASGLAGELRVGARAVQRVVVATAVLVLGVFIGMSLVGLSALPVRDGTTALGTTWIEAPVLGVVSAFEPAWLQAGLALVVGATGAVVLATAVLANMLGVSRLAYSLAIHSQIPGRLGRLHPHNATPHVAIWLAALAAFVLTLTGDVEFLAGMFAFGAMITATLAHLSLIVLRYREPDARLVFRVPGSIELGGASLPVPALAGALLSAAGWVSVIALHEGARIFGTVWMAAGLVLYVGHRRRSGLGLRERTTVDTESLQEAPEIEYGSILVPVSGRPLDDDIVGTAGRLASEEAEEGEGGTIIEALYVIEVPMSLPLEARIPEERVAEARAALARAKEVGEEYEGVEVATALVRARSAGQRIVEEARRRGVEAIVLAAEEPTRVRGGALLGGRGGPRDRFLGETERYVVEKAPCRVVLTAPPAADAPGPADEGRGREPGRGGVKPRADGRAPATARGGGARRGPDGSGRGGGAGRGPDGSGRGPS